MVSPTVGDVVLVSFPFSDLSSSKLRPALVLAGTTNDDWILCQITSKAYADPQAIQIESADFSFGSLHRTSYARPAKIFCANSSIIKKVTGTLKKTVKNSIRDAIIEILKSAE